jgi:hypothetical protein
VQCGGIAGTPESHRTTDDEREDADAGEQVIERARTVRDRGQTDIDDVARPQPEDGVSDGVSCLVRVQHANHIARVLDGPVVNGQQKIAALQTDRCRWTVDRNLCRDHALWIGHPQDAVFHLVPRRAGGHVRSAEAQERRNQDQR